MALPMTLARIREFSLLLISGSDRPYHLDEFISSVRGFCLTISILLPFCIEIPVSKQCRPTSDAALPEVDRHRFHMSPKLILGLKMVNKLPPSDEERCPHTGRYEMYIFPVFRQPRH